MKKVATLIVKGLFVIVLYTGSTFVLSAKGIQTVSEASAAVSPQQVYQYLVARGYKVSNLSQVTGSLDWTAETTKNNKNFLTTVHVVGSEIIGNTDVPI
jgi:hypothetical protein